VRLNAPFIQHLRWGLGLGFLCQISSDGGGGAKDGHVNVLLIDSYRVKYSLVSLFPGTIIPMNQPRLKPEFDSNQR
jgi:hypothetical protein